MAVTPDCLLRPPTCSWRSTPPAAISLMRCSSFGCSLNRSAGIPSVMARASTAIPPAWPATWASDSGGLRGEPTDLHSQDPEHARNGLCRSALSPTDHAGHGLESLAHKRGLRSRVLTATRCWQACRLVGGRRYWAHRRCDRDDRL